VRAFVGRDGEKRFVQCLGSFPFALGTEEGTRSKKIRGERSGVLEAAMHAQVVAVSTTPGAVVRRGDLLVTLAAMKMEMRVVAPFDGTVLAVSCTVGDVVERGRRLVEVEPAKEA
jgi:acetyl/propionyl-CoA carboxylase alpha subunit